MGILSPGPPGTGNSAPLGNWPGTRGVGAGRAPVLELVGPSRALGRVVALESDARSSARHGARWPCCPLSIPTFAQLGGAEDGVGTEGLCAKSPRTQRGRSCLAPH